MKVSELSQPIVKEKKVASTCTSLCVIHKLWCSSEHTIAPNVHSHLLPHSIWKCVWTFPK